MPPAATESPSISPISIERLRGCRVSWKEAIENAENAKEVQLKAKKTRDERHEALTTATDEDASDKKIADLSRDLSKAEKKFIEFDRRKRSTADIAAKLGQKFVEIAEKISEGNDDDLFAKGVDSGDAWKKQPIADLVGDLQAAPFIKNDIYMVGDLLKKGDEIADLIKSGDLVKMHAHYVIQTVALALQNLKRSQSLPQYMRALADKPRIAPMEVKKEEKDDAPPESDATGSMPGESSAK